MLVGMTIVGAIAVVWWLPGYLRAPPGTAWVVWLLQGAVGALAVVAIAASRPYWIRGGAIELFPDSVVVPGHMFGSDRFAVVSTRIDRLHVIQAIHAAGAPTGARLDRGEFITLIDGARRRKFSERVLVAPGSLPCLLADLSACARGDPPRGPDGTTAVVDNADASIVAAKPADRYEAHLDAELREFD
jgi:hypothetical protein